MKLTFNEKIKISPILNKNQPILIQNSLYTQYNNSILLTNVLNGKILEKFDFENISCFTVFKNFLYVANTKILIFSLEEKKIIKEIEIGKILINNIKVNEEDLYISCIDGSLKKIIKNEGYNCEDNNNNNSHNDHNQNININNISNGLSIKITSFNNPILNLIIKNNKIIAYDGEVIKVLEGSKLELEIKNLNIKGIDFDENLYWFTEDGIYKNKEKIIKIKDVQGILVKEDKIIICKGTKIKKYLKENYELIDEDEDEINVLSDGEIEKLEESDIENMDNGSKEGSIGEGDSIEDINNEDLIEDSYDEGSTEGSMDQGSLVEPPSSNNHLKPKILVFNENLICTDQNEIYLLSPDFTVKNLIIGNIDEITSMALKDDLIVISSSSDKIFYTYRDFYENGEYVFRGFLLEGHSDIVMSIKISGDKMISSSRDGFVILWEIKNDGYNDGDYNYGYENRDYADYKVNGDNKVNNDGNSPNINNNHNINEINTKRLKKSYFKYHQISILNKFDCGGIGQNTCDIYENLLVVGGDEGLIHFFNFKENILIKKIHNKEINSLLIFKEKKLIITASQDKEIKVLDFNSKVIQTLTGHRKGITYINILNNNLLASCSLDKTIRLWDLNTWECISVLEGHDSGVLSTIFYKNYLISSSVTGKLKIWNLSNKKCENNLKFPNKIWDLKVKNDELLVSSSDQLIFLKDESQKQNLEILEKETKLAKQKIEIEKSIKENDYLNLLELMKDTKDYKMLFKVIEMNMEIMDDTGNLDDTGKNLDMEKNLNMENLENPADSHQNLNAEKNFINQTPLTLILDKLSKHQIFKVLQENSKFKNCKTNNLILNFLIESKQFGSKEVMKEIEKRVEKEFEGVDSIYRRLISYDIFNKKI